MTDGVPTPEAVPHGGRFPTLTGRNLALWTGYTGIDPEQNSIGRGGGDNLRDENFLDAVDGWGLPLPSRWAFAVRFGF